AGVGIGRRGMEVLHPRFEGIEPLDDALDPAQPQLRTLIQRCRPRAAGPQAPLRLVVAYRQTTVAGDVPVVGKGLDVGALDRDLDRALGVGQRETLPAVEPAAAGIGQRERRRTVLVGLEIPLELQRARVAAEIAG